VLAEQDSAELDQIVERMLQVSDNEAAEVLSRHVAISTDRPGSFAAGGAAVREVLAELSVPARGVRINDGSGLSRDNRVTREALASVLQLGADPDLPDLRTVITGLPVAAFSGSLAYRYLAPPTFPARGVVRAKTGTLTGVNGLAGTVVTRSGGLLGFGLLADRVRPVDTLTARQQLEEMTAALARCGCRG
jgi:D-alanyl-D-alanine carboxypeptidase/D-alanyl-D-alanine-endopeptidase (penicillin-binding protein 4)